MIRPQMLFLAFTVFVLSGTSSIEAQSTTFADDFNRPDGTVGNDWSLWGNPNTTLVGGEVRTFGSSGLAGGMARTLSVTFPISFSFDFRTLNTSVDSDVIPPYNDGGWSIAFNASSAAFASPAQVKFYQYAGSLNITRETSGGIVDTQPKLSEPIRGWQDFTAVPGHIAGTVNADLSASITVTYSNGLHVSTSFAAAPGSSVGALLLLGNSNRSNGPHILDNIRIGPPALDRLGTFAQVASGGGWKTTLTLLNPFATTVTARLDFYADDGRPLILPLAFPQSGSNTTSSSANVMVRPNASLVIESEALTPSISVGWADVQATAPLTGYSIFRLRPPGFPDSEGTVPLDTPLSSFLVPYDNTRGYRTGVALANQSAATASIAVVLTDQNGLQIATSQMTLAAFGHTSFFVNDRFSQSANQLGIIQFQSASGAITGTGLRFSPSGSFTSVPIIH